MAAEFVALKLAEAVVSQVIQRITDLLIHEANSLRGVRDDILNLQAELKWMQSFLKDADRKQGQDNSVRIWIAEVRDVASEIEDAIETYVYKVHSSYFKAFHLRKLRAHINSIKDKLKAIGDRAQRYKIEFQSGDLASSLLSDRRMTYPEEDGDDVITLKSTVTALMSQLMKEEDRLCVVSIVGMGGLGKTTLARKVYNDIDVKNSFECHAWVFISQQFSPREVLTQILMQVRFQSEEVRHTKEFLKERKSIREILKDMDVRELFVLLKTELTEKRYLVVLDDVWSVNAWNSIKDAFPKGKLGSKVVLTTRIKEVAMSADPYCCPVEPSLLTLTQSWELLKQKAFPKEIFGKTDPPSEFEELGMKMVAECGGLPLAIVVLGGLLRTKNSLEEWNEVQNDVRSRINKFQSEKLYRLEDILELSYQELPYYLKPCFLYLACFPEDSEILKKRLIWLWIAEGFIQIAEKEGSKGSSMEDVGEQYLNELIDRCIVQVDKKDRTGKRVKTFRLHDIMRDFCLSKAMSEAFLSLMLQNEANMAIDSDSPIPSRRITMHVNHGGLLQRTTSQFVQVHSHVRSLLCFDLHTFPNLLVRETNFQLLRVLELNFLTYFDVTKVPFRVGCLIHLRYLKLGGKIKLPHSLSNLQSLQVLDLRYYEFLGNDFTISLSRLRNLRHLFLPQWYSHPFWAIMPMFGKNTLRKIETLKKIHAEDLISHSSVPPMPSIKILEIDDFKSSQEVTLVIESLKSHSQLDRLQSLTMHMNFGLCLPKMEFLSSCHALSKLSLLGELSLENISYLPKSITKLYLWQCGLNQEKTEALEKLPNLRVLRVATDERVSKLLCSNGGFPDLEILFLDFLVEFKEWEVQEGAMPNLKRLDISYVRELKMIPEGLKHLSTLRELNIRAMSEEFEKRIRKANEDGIEGEDYYKVRHVPSIKFFEAPF